jgi:LPXTG-motif cell wall-anchored protein
VVTSSLPFTGADVIELLVIGVVLIAVGVLLLPRRRHSTPTA